jgi:hypothetical protein
MSRAPFCVNGRVGGCADEMLRRDVLTATSLTCVLSDPFDGFYGDLLLHRGFLQTPVQLLHNLLHQRRLRSRENE